MMHQLLGTPHEILTNDDCVD